MIQKAAFPNFHIVTFKSYMLFKNYKSQCITQLNLKKYSVQKIFFKKMKSITHLKKKKNRLVLKLVRPSAGSSFLANAVTGGELFSPIIWCWSC